MYTAAHRTRRAYLAGLLDQPPAWILASMLNPSASMLRQPSTLALHAIALRIRGT